MSGISELSLTKCGVIPIEEFDSSPKPLEELAFDFFCCDDDWSWSYCILDDSSAMAGFRRLDPKHSGAPVKAMALIQSFIDFVTTVLFIRTSLFLSSTLGVLQTAATGR